MKQLFFVFCIFCSSVFSNENPEFNWEKDENNTPPVSGQINPQPQINPLPQQSQPPQMNPFPDSFGRVRELIEEMRSRFFDDADSIFNDPFFTEPFFQNPASPSPFRNPLFRKQPQANPIPPSSSPFLTRPNQFNDDIKIIEKQDLIIVELPLEQNNTINNYNIKVNGRILSIEKTSEISEENHEQNSRSTYHSFSSSGFSRTLPTEVEPDFSRIQAGGKLILTFRKK